MSKLNELQLSAFERDDNRNDTAYDYADKIIPYLDEYSETDFKSAFKQMCAENGFDYNDAWSYYSLVEDILRKENITKRIDDMNIELTRPFGVTVKKSGGLRGYNRILAEQQTENKIDKNLQRRIDELTIKNGELDFIIKTNERKYKTWKKIWAAISFIAGALVTHFIEKLL